MNSIIFIVIINFVAGMLCIIYGVKWMSKGLEASNPGAIKKILSTYTGKLIPAFLTGVIITALLQSSTAVIIITVGLVNSGLMKFSQAVGIIYGANLGTTVTAQLMSFQVSALSLPILFIGITIFLLARKQAMRNLALSIIGLGLLFTGIRILSSSVSYIKESKTLYNLFITYGKNPYIGIIIGTINTMLVQSSSATVGATIVIFNAGLISFDAAIGLTLGDNIGTCMTAQLASIGTSIYARRTAWAHTLYNIIGVLVVLAFLDPFSALVESATALMGQDQTRLIANTHTIFNLLSALVFLPLTKFYVKFIEWIVS